MATVQPVNCRTVKVDDYHDDLLEKLYHHPKFSNTELVLLETLHWENQIQRFSEIFPGLFPVYVAHQTL